MNDDEMYTLACSLKRAQKTERIMHIHNKELYAYIKTLYPKYPDLTFAERLYWFTHNITEMPVCKNCGGPVKFIDGRDGYHEFCCAKCSNNNNDKKKKAVATNIKKYGVENIQQIKEINQKGIQTKIEKYGSGNNYTQITKTKLERYGDVNYNNFEKIKETKLERYGDENYTNLEKVRQTKLERYGDENYTNLEKVRQTTLNHYGFPTIFCDPIYQTDNRQRIINSKDFLVEYTDDKQWICKCPHPECTKCDEKTYISNSIVHNLRALRQLELCTKLNPVYPCSPTNKGTSIELYIRNILDDYNINYQCNVRNILQTKKELDIYIPDYKLAIECNGIYFHSFNFDNKNNKKHINKYEECANENIQLLTIWEDQIVNHPDIVESIILSKLGIYKQRIYARKCTIKEVGSKEAILFLNKNHIQGKTTCSIRIGLYYDNELVSLMTFGAQKRCSGGTKENNWELNRFCNKLNTQVVGAASRLLNFFEKHYNPNILISYSSNDISNGALYSILGFENDNKITNAYWYIQSGTLKRFHRTNFSKSRLCAMGVDIAGKTENDIMSQLPYFKIYDSGHIRWIKKYK